MEGQVGVIRSIIDELHSSDIQWNGKVVLLEVSLMNLIPILWMSKEIKWKVKVVLLEVSLMNFIFEISKETKWKLNAWYYSKYH